ncbi:MAG: nucleotide exchange factor GrpE [Flavobacteriales bacterium]|nr:nucleotide exchange factor GrpE [Flavobacteriales bacterium]
MEDKEAKNNTETNEQEAQLKDQAQPSPSEEQAVEPQGDQLKELNDKYLRLYSEFENFRKRTIRERADLIKTAGEDVFLALLPILDDFERALQSIEETKETKAIREGIGLIHHKLVSALEGKGLRPMKSKGESFDVEKHEAISQVPAPDEASKGKVIEELEKGYTLYDKVIRYAKVVIGQ